MKTTEEHQKKKHQHIFQVQSKKIGQTQHFQNQNQMEPLVARNKLKVIQNEIFYDASTAIHLYK
jgi:hypothetical protein